MPDRASEKSERLASILERGMAMVYLDARTEGVRVPEYLNKEAHLRLNLSYRFDPPDLELSDWGIRSTLRFGGRRFAVAIPWCSVFAIASHATQQFWTFPEDMPLELLQRVSETAPAPAAGATAATPPVVPMLREVSAELPAASGPSDAEVDQATPALSRRGHLRLVK